MRPEAERYCSLIERAVSFDREEFVAELAASLGALLSGAARLPDVTPTDADLPDRPSDEQVRERFAAVHKTLGEWGDYWTTLGPFGEDAEDPLLLPLADDLVDIWLDLKPGLLAIEGGAPPEDVTWDWRFGFYSHWGRHATEALRALHARLAENGGPPRRRAR
jgi:hypothetical protein